MAKRSPNYPSLSLPDAVSKITALYPKAHRAESNRGAVAQLLGYSGLNGASVAVIGALRQYGLLSGSKDNVSISDDGESISIEPVGSTERTEALLRCLKHPVVFQGLLDQFGHRLPADEMIKPYLVRRGFSVSAVPDVIQAFRESIEFIANEGGIVSGSAAITLEGAGSEAVGAKASPTSQATRRQPHDATVLEGSNFTEDTFTLDEGQVVFRYPRQISEESLDILESWIELQVRRAKASAKKQRNSRTDLALDEDDDLL